MRPVTVRAGLGRYEFKPHRLQLAGGIRPRADLAPILEDCRRGGGHELAPHLAHRLALRVEEGAERVGTAVVFGHSIGSRLRLAVSPAALFAYSQTHPGAPRSDDLER